VRLEASTKSPIHNLIHEFLINMAFTMACPNFKKGLKMAFGPLGVKCTFSTVDQICLQQDTCVYDPMVSSGSV
jgi:hypothetical protein